MQSSHPSPRSRGWVASWVTALPPIAGALERVGLGEGIKIAGSLAIRGYQVYLSPRKGFSCAHRVMYGGLSCSEFFRQALVQDGLAKAVPLFQQRLADCRAASVLARSQLGAARLRMAIGDGEGENSDEYGDEKYVDVEQEWIRSQRSRRNHSTSSCERSSRICDCCSPAPDCDPVMIDPSDYLGCDGNIGASDCLSCDGLAGVGDCAGVGCCDAAAGGCSW